MIIKKLNPKPEGLTIEKVKACKGLENLSDEEAQNIIDSLRRLAILSFKVYKELKEDNKNYLEKIAA